MAEFVLTPQIKALALRSLKELKGEVVFIVNAETSKPIRMGQNGKVTANGGLGQGAQFKVRRGDRPHALGPVVTFQNVATGKFLAIKKGEVDVGGGGEHCEFIVEMANMAVFLKKHNKPKHQLGFNADGSPVEADGIGNGPRGRFFIFDADAVVRVGKGGGGGGHAHPHAHPNAHPHPAHPKHHGMSPAKPHPKQLFVLKISNEPMFLHASHGLKDKSECILKGGPTHPKAHTNKPSQFVLLPTAFPGTFLIKSAHSDLCLHALGGSVDGSKLVLHGDEKYARGAANSKFTFIPAGGHDFLVKVLDQDLCLHAVGGSKDGNSIALHGGKDYNVQHGNGKFQFVPL